MSQAIWHTEQLLLKNMLCLEGTLDHVKHVVGVDISYIKGSDNAICTAVLLHYPDWKVIGHVTKSVVITEPYIAGYLAFREVAHYVQVYQELREKYPEWCSDLILVDGNGILHPAGFGLASHLGVLLDVPTIGCAKKLHLIDGLTKDCGRGVSPAATPIQGKSGKVYGWAVTTSNTTNPVYFSPGHRVSMESVYKFAIEACLYREPEPTRVADRLSRREGGKPPRGWDPLSPQGGGTP